ncbi:MAG: hypothetical protein WBA76_01030 [Phormidesmis sp.]
MISLKSSSLQTKLFKASLLALTAIGIALPGVSSAQATSDVSDVLDKSDTDTSEVSKASNLKASSAQSVLEDGNYLFGQSPNPNQIGSDYIVFAVKDNRTVGAFYQPNSSFDCFSGEVTPERLAVNIVESYTQTVYPYAIAMTTDEPLVAGEAAGAYTIEGFSQLAALSAQDQEILAVCQADLAQ